MPHLSFIRSPMIILAPLAINLKSLIASSIPSGPWVSVEAVVLPVGCGVGSAIGVGVVTVAVTTVFMVWVLMWMRLGGSL